MSNLAYGIPLVDSMLVKYDQVLVTNIVGLFEWKSSFEILTIFT